MLQIETLYDERKLYSEVAKEEIKHILEITQRKYTYNYSHICMKHI